MITEQDIVGTWLMDDRGATTEHDHLVADRYGAEQEGLLMISPDGWLLAAVCWADRPPLTDNPAFHTDAPDVDRLQAFDTYLSYGGNWRLEDGRLITKVRFALNPGWVGTEEVRGLELLDDGRLKLTVTRRWPTGEEIEAWVTWQRAEATLQPKSG